MPIAGVTTAATRGISLRKGSFSRAAPSSVGPCFCPVLMSVSLRTNSGERKRNSSAPMRCFASCTHFVRT